MAELCQPFLQPKIVCPYIKKYKIGPRAGSVCYSPGMKRTDFLNAMYATTILPIAAQAATGREIAGVSIPDTALTREAEQLARASEPLEIFNHSLRTYLFAQLLAQARKIDHDSELVFVASILHDTGLSAQYMSPTHRFEADGANLARQLLARHAITGERADRVWDAIALHDNGGLARWKQPEVQLVNAGVNSDFGGNLSEMRREDILAVLSAAPRQNFIEAFLNACAVVAAKKPAATGGSFVADVGYRRVPGFHLENFCDAVKDDPFKSFTPR